MGDLPAVQSLWIGGELSRMEKTSIGSFLEKGHDFDLYTYGSIKGIPRQVNVIEAREILDGSSIDKCIDNKDYATLSDIFRYKLLFEKGGIWVDTDIICLRPFNFDDEHVFASERVERQSRFEIKLPYRPVGCVIKAPAGSEIIHYCLKKSRKKEFENIEWAEVGPDLLDITVEEFSMDECVYPPYKFCPIPWWKWRDFIKDDLKTRTKEKIKQYLLNPYSYHLWNSKWSEGKANKNKKYPKRTIYGRMQSSVL